MTYRVVITDAALEDASVYLDYLIEESQSLAVADRWWRRAVAAVEALEDFPHRGPKPPEDELRGYTIRAIIVEPCLFLYRVDDERRVVEVFAFRHGRQRVIGDRLPQG